jgi:hypothetical protein
MTTEELYAMIAERVKLEIRAQSLHGLIVGVEKMSDDTLRALIAHHEPKVETKPFVAVENQFFSSVEHWLSTSNQRLTAHPEYKNTEHGGTVDDMGWRGHHFTALCFDQKGRRVRHSGDFTRARDEGTFPVWWVWPDQIAALLMRGEGRGS